MFSAFLWIVWPAIAVLVFEHLVLTRIYRKESALTRLTLRLSDSGTTDWAMAAIKWFPVRAVGHYLRLITVPGLFLALFVALHETFDYRGIVSLNSIESTALQFLIWYLVFDFGHYLAHRLMHEVPCLWRIHKLHHAVTEMNVINGIRTSFAEGAFTTLISFGLIVLLFGEPRIETAVALIVIRRFVELLQHSDLPWDYGWIGYVIAGPRFHRMHHSSDPRDYDANYGNIFTFWDAAFGTVSKRYKTEGSAMADEVALGLDTPEETAKYNRWYYALLNETLPHYAFALWRRRSRNGTAKPAEKDGQSAPDVTSIGGGSAVQAVNTPHRVPTDFNKSK